MKSIRGQFADTMLDIGTNDSRLVVLVGDISHTVLQPFAMACPDRYFNIGICEPTIVNMAAGLAKVGLVPVVHTIAPFIVERSYEQIKLDFAYQNLGVNLITVGGSFDYSKLGCSHHCYTDVSLMSHLNDARIVLPGSAFEFDILFRQLFDQNTVNYFRISENPHNIEFAVGDLILGKGIRICSGADITIAVTGAQLSNVLAASKLLGNSGISTEILYFHTLKPFDIELICSSLRVTRRLLTVEELSAHDGLHNLCLRAAVGIGDINVSQLAIDGFLRGYGSYEDLCETAGLTVHGIVSQVEDLVRP